jgi:uncharacterized phage-associated protein
MKFALANIEKAIEAAGVLLRAEHSRQMSRLRLLKLLYIANRRAIKELSQPIIAGKSVAMKHGPVLSEVYDLIKEEHPSTARWAHFFARDGRDVRLVKQPPVGELSTAEIEILQKISDELALMNDWEIVDITHRFGEWDAHYPNKDALESHPIPFEDIVRCASPDSADSILGHVAQRQEFDRLFAS